MEITPKKENQFTSLMSEPVETQTAQSLQRWCRRPAHPLAFQRDQLCLTLSWLLSIRLKPVSEQTLLCVPKGLFILYSLEMDQKWLAFALSVFACFLLCGELPVRSPRTGGCKDILRLDPSSLSLSGAETDRLG